MLKIGVQSACWYSEENPEESMRMIRECGFDAVDFNIDMKLPGTAINKGPLTTFFDKTEEELYEFYRPLKEAAEHNGITFSQMHAPFPLYLHGNDAVNDYLIMAVAKCCAVCAYVGCPAIVVHPSTLAIKLGSKEKEKEVNLSVYRRMIPAAKKYGVKLCLENLFISWKGRMIEGACADIAEAVWYIDTLNREAGADVFGFCLDVGHANLLGRNIYEYIKGLDDRLTVLHIHDNDGRGDLHMTPYTYTTNNGADLVCDWEGFMRGLRDIGYTGTLSFETFRVTGAYPRELWPDALKMISAIGRYFRSRIEA